MNSFTARIPGGFDVMLEPIKFEFENTNDLINNEWIKKWSDDPKFNYFSMSESVLMCTYGNKYWALGYIEKPDEINLPRWEQIDENEKEYCITIVEIHYKEVDDWIYSEKSKLWQDKERLIQEKKFYGVDLEKLKKEVDDYIKENEYNEKDPFGIQSEGIKFNHWSTTLVQKEKIIKRINYERS